MFDSRDFETYFQGGIVGLRCRADGDYKPRLIRSLESVDDFEEPSYTVRLLSYMGEEESSEQFKPLNNLDSIKKMPDNLGYFQTGRTVTRISWKMNNRHKKIMERRNISADVNESSKLSVIFGQRIGWEDIFYALFNPYYYSFQEAVRMIYNKESLAVALSPSLAICCKTYYDMPVLMHCGQGVGFVDDSENLHLAPGCDFIEEILKESG